MFRPARITSSTSNNCEAMTGLHENDHVRSWQLGIMQRTRTNKDKLKMIPRVDDLSFYRVVVKDALQLWIHWFSCVVIQTNNIFLIMLRLRFLAVVRITNNVLKRYTKQLEEGERVP